MTRGFTFFFSVASAFTYCLVSEQKSNNQSEEAQVYDLEKLPFVLFSNDVSLFLLFFCYFAAIPCPVSFCLSPLHPISLIVPTTTITPIILFGTQLGITSYLA